MPDGQAALAVSWTTLAADTIPATYRYKTTEPSAQSLRKAEKGWVVGNPLPKREIRPYELTAPSPDEISRRKELQADKARSKLRRKEEQQKWEELESRIVEEKLRLRAAAGLARAKMLAHKHAQYQAARLERAKQMFEFRQANERPTTPMYEKMKRSFDQQQQEEVHQRNQLLQARHEAIWSPINKPPQGTRRSTGSSTSGASRSASQIGAATLPRPRPRTRSLREQQRAADDIAAVAMPRTSRSASTLPRAIRPLTATRPDGQESANVAALRTRQSLSGQPPAGMPWPSLDGGIPSEDGGMAAAAYKQQSTLAAHAVPQVIESSLEDGENQSVTHDHPTSVDSAAPGHPDEGSPMSSPAADVPAPREPCDQDQSLSHETTDLTDIQSTSAQETVHKGDREGGGSQPKLVGSETRQICAHTMETMDDTTVARDGLRPHDEVMDNFMARADTKHLLARTSLRGFEASAESKSVDGDAAKPDEEYDQSLPNAIAPQVVKSEDGETSQILHHSAVDNPHASSQLAADVHVSESSAKGDAHLHTDELDGSVNEEVDGLLTPAESDPEPEENGYTSGLASPSDAAVHGTDADGSRQSTSESPVEAFLSEGEALCGQSRSEDREFAARNQGDSLETEDGLEDMQAFLDIPQASRPNSAQHAEVETMQPSGLDSMAG